MECKALVYLEQGISYLPLSIGWRDFGGVGVLDIQMQVVPVDVA